MRSLVTIARRALPPEQPRHQPPEAVHEQVDPDHQAEHPQARERPLRQDHEARQDGHDARHEKQPAEAIPFGDRHIDARDAGRDQGGRKHQGEQYRGSQGIGNQDPAPDGVQRSQQRPPAVRPIRRAERLNDLEQPRHQQGDAEHDGADDRGGDRVAQYEHARQHENEAKQYALPTAGVPGLRQIARQFRMRHRTLHRLNIRFAEQPVRRDDNRASG